MSADRPRVLIASSKSREGEFKTLFSREPLDQWQSLYADSFAQARYTLQQSPCDVLLVHEDLLEIENHQGLAWLAWRRDLPIVLTGSSAARFQKAYELGVHHCLPYDMALTHAALVATVLGQAMKNLETTKLLKRSREHLSQTRRHLDRLVTLMWRTSPQHGDQQWYSQPYMMERLQEEIARAERHKVPLSLAIGEMVQPDREEGELPAWTPDILVKEKRRCDVVGQYGSRGFLILMVHTPKHGGIVCCKRLQSSLEHLPESKPTLRGPLRAYFGITTTDGDRHSIQSVLRSAEQNLDAARHEPTMRIVAD